jgi:hypothetical protein
MFVPFAIFVVLGFVWSIHAFARIRTRDEESRRRRYNLASEEFRNGDSPEIKKCNLPNSRLKMGALLKKKGEKRTDLEQKNKF